MSAKKFDKGKLPYHLLPIDALDEIVKVLQFGAGKYGARNWEEGGPWSQIYSAAMRHLTAWWAGDNLDPESKRHHLAHAACCVIFALSFALRKIGKDNRRKIKIKRLL